MSAASPVPAVESRGVDWRIFRRLYRMTDRYADMRRTVLITSFIRAFQRPAQFWALAAIINGPIAAHDWRGSLLWTAGFIGLAISTAIVLHLRQINQNSLGEALVHDLRNEIFGNLQRQPLSFYHKTKLGRILSHFVTDLEGVRRGIQLVVFIAQEFVQLIFCGGLMAYYNWPLFLVILAFAPFLVWANRYFQPRIHKSSRVVAESGSRLTSYLAESIRGMRVIQGFTRQGHGGKLFGAQASRLAEDNVQLATESALYAPVFGITGQVFLAALLLVGGYGALHGFAHTDIESLVAFFFLPTSFFLSVQAAASYYPGILTSQVGAERVLQLIDATPAWSDGEEAIELPDPRPSASAAAPSRASVAETAEALANIVSPDSSSSFKKAPASNGAPPSSSALLRLLRLCWQERADSLRVLFCQVSLLALGLAGLGSAGLGIDYLRSILQPGAPKVHWPHGIHPPVTWSPFAVLAAVAAFVILTAGLRGVLTWLSGILLARLVHRRVISGLQTAVFGKLQHLSFRFFDQHSRGEIINRATGDIQSIRMFMDTVLIQTVVTALTIAVYVSYMVTINVRLTFACLLTLPLLIGICVSFSRSMHPFYLRSRERVDRMILALAESIEGVAVVKGFAREAEAAEKFQARNRDVRLEQRKIFWRNSLFLPTIDALTQVSLVVLLVYGGRMVMDGKLPLGTGLVVFAGLLQQFATQVMNVAQIANGVQESLTGARRVFDIMDTPEGLPRPQNPHVLGATVGAVRFENISFSHGGPAVLNKIDFTVSPGECIAIVGETGSGKSALLNLIPRFYDPTGGRVLIDGHDVKSLDLQSLRRRVGMVFQESFLFSDTVAANIAFGQPDASHESIVAAAKAACAHDFVEALPKGYDTILGESGVDLSGGQRQRLTIARALLGNPSILLLDDPTAAIDPETEHEILTAIDRALQGRTTFVVAHRLSTLRRANRILVLERGRIVQIGNHEELIKQDGPYRRAAQHQLIDEDSRQLLADELYQANSEERLADEAQEVVPS